MPKATETRENRIERKTRHYVRLSERHGVWSVVLYLLNVIEDEWEKRIEHVGKLTRIRRRVEP